MQGSQSRAHAWMRRTFFEVESPHSVRTGIALGISNCRRVAWMAACLLPLLGAGASAPTFSVHQCSHTDAVAEGTGFRSMRRGTSADSTQAVRSGRISTTVDDQILVELTPEDTSPANLFDLNGRTVTFAPDGRGAYSRDVRNLEWEENLGEDVTPEWDRHRDGVEVDFGGFEFDYAGRQWSSVFISRHGVLTFGAPLPRNSSPWFTPMSDAAAWLAATTTISALYKPAFGGLYGRDPLASQFVAHHPDRVVFTWFASEYDAYRLDVPEHAERFQAILHADGTIQFNYGHITVGDGIVGLLSDVVEKGDLIASVADATDPDLPGHLDLLEVALYEADADTVILEFTTREHIPEPTSARYLYRLWFDTDAPYSKASSDIDLVWKIEIGGDHKDWGGRSRAGDAANQVELLADVGDLQGLSASVWAGAHEYGANGSFVGGDGTGVVSLRLPMEAPVDLSAHDRGLSRTQREVFHYRGVPDTQAMACRIIANLGDQFDQFIFHSEFRVDAQTNESTGTVNYYDGVRGIGSKATLRGAPCGDGRLLSHYGRPHWIGEAGGRSHEWRLGKFDGDLVRFVHGFMHSWTAYLSYVSGNGARQRLFADSFADDCRCHWRGTLHAPAAFPWRGEEARSLMNGGEGGGVWRDNGDGTFTAVTNFGDASGLSWLDLYAMGLADASEVRDLFVLHNIEPAPGNHNPRRNGYYEGTFYADKESISVNQITAAMGPREPPTAHSQKDFNAGLVYLLEPGQSPDPEMLRLHAEYRDRVVEYWSHITGGRSRITTAVPRGLNRLFDQVLELGDANATFDLSDSFSHFIDAVSYDAESSDNDIVSVTVIAGELLVTPVGTGNATVTVTAAAADGERITRRFVVEVKPPAEANRTKWRGWRLEWLRGLAEEPEDEP